MTYRVPVRALETKELAGPILAIDTSGALAVALVAPGRDPVVRGAAAERRHAELLAPLVSEVLHQAELTVPDLAAIAVGTGPASFTGLRVGLMTARALAAPSDRPVWGVPSLDVAALAYARRRRPAIGAHVLVVRDAKRRELFHAGYQVCEGGLDRIFGPAVAAPAALPAACAAHLGSWAVTGDLDPAAAYGLDADAIGGRDPEPSGVDAALLALIAAERAVRGPVDPPEPLYLRRPDVHEPAGVKRASQ